MILTGTYERNLDAKGRLSLPAPVRKGLSEHVYVLPALDADALYVFSDESFEKWVLGLFEKRGGFDARKREDQELMRRLTSLAVPMDIDGAARIGLPVELREKKHLTREVTVVGNFDHLEIWDRATWEQASSQASDEDLANIFFS
ncbi:division/cell wall cluster transcriptional repressor MraZ [Collinsella sp. zg1085]|uniref:division/cell wall cluster transcriptional repressor MraZ n=1 Tax=Collinsella sp. zg1085 TaxID=2844380 RepID=UPI001C0D6212|nr:division/cell wall cluster transcriptional repressor MraZ [Collinsella sp. zg1085]QWT18036.1 division/cell wall cluster transcriptional repressor MraZ [Collinsella sp. zg1085]